MKKLKSILFFFCFNFILMAQTEKNIDKQTLIWSRYINQLTINNDFMLQTELDYRTFINPSVQSQYGFRTQIKYKINDKNDLGTGFTLFSVATQDPENIRPYQIPEYRLHQDFTTKQNIGKIAIFQRYQVEERWFQNSNATETIRGTTFFWRFRYRIQAEFDLYKKSNHYLKTVLHNEIMINGGKNIVKNTFDQNRIYAALQLGINSKTAFEIGYMNVFQQARTGLDYIDRDVIRITLFHKLKI